MAENYNPGNEGTTSAADIFFKLPIGDALGCLLKIGAGHVQTLTQTATMIFNKVADSHYMKMCFPVLTLDNCIEWMELRTKEYPQAAYFFIYVEKNVQPRNENDNISTTLALVDFMKKPIPVYSKKGFFSSAPSNDIVCQVIPSGTIDGKLINVLNGNPSVIIKLNQTQEVK